MVSAAPRATATPAQNQANQVAKVTFTQFFTIWFLIWIDLNILPLVD